VTKNEPSDVDVWTHEVHLLTMCPSLAATKHTRLPLKNDPLSDPNADSAAPTDMIQPQLPSTLLLVTAK